MTVAPKEGTKAPKFALEADDGTTVKLSDFKGKNVVLYFYPKDDTPGCTVEACSFRDAYREIQKQGAVVLGVSRDTVAKHQKFKAKYDLTFPLLSDPDAEVISAYGSWGPKKFMGRSFDGILRTTFLIDGKGVIRKVYPKVSPKTHVEQVLADLKALQSPGK
jgi:peroxiredoxin Q/BCP